MSLCVLVVISLAVVLPRLSGQVAWTPDGLFYQAHVFQLQGLSESAAIHRAFSGGPASSVAFPLIRSRAWVAYSEQFYARRWVVPVMATVIWPIAGIRSLLDVSLLGYVIIGPLMFILLRRRFTDFASLAATVFCLLLPPLREAAGHPLTDTWGLALTITCLIACGLASDRGRFWFVLWAACLLALSFTRDTTLVPLVGAAMILALHRNRRNAALLVTGIVASLPALLLFGAPLVRQQAYILSGFRIPSQSSLSFVLAHYPTALGHLLDRDLSYPRTLGSLAAFWYAAGLLAAAALLHFLLRSPRSDVFFALQLGALIGAAVTVLLAINYTDLRLELAFVPPVAAALAFGLETCARRIRPPLRQRRGPRLHARPGS